MIFRIFGPRHHEVSWHKRQNVKNLSCQISKSWKADVHGLRSNMEKEVEIMTDGVHPPNQLNKARAPYDAEAAETQRRALEAHKTYGRGRKVPIKSVRDKKLRSSLKSLELKYKDATVKAKDAEILLENQSGFLEPEAELERTYKVRQDDLRKEIAVETARKGFELKLDSLGPYTVDYTRNGRGLLLAGRKGHVSTMNWRAGTLGCEMQLQQTIRDAKWLHNDQYFAVAQKSHVYIYDQNGVELHCLQKHIEVTNMEFLPYHFLLATVVSDSSKSLLRPLTLSGECWLSEVY